MHATVDRAEHRADIQGLRAVAVILVVLAHAGVGFAAGGFVGVDVFFVLSGFLITGLLLAEARRRGSISIVDFYVRRARRILPAAVLTLVVTDTAALFLLNFVRARDAVVDSVNAAGFAANFHFAARGVDYFAREAPPSPFLHYWSLSVEEQFYLVWPLLISLVLFLGRERWLPAVVALLGAASLGWSIYQTQAAPTTAYFSPFTRAWELALGAALAVGASRIERTPAAVRLVMGWIGLVAIAGSAVLFSDATPFPGAFALVPTLGTALLIVAGAGGAPSRFAVTPLLSTRPMCGIGDRSYAIYLWHWPVLILGTAYFGTGANAGLVLFAFALSFVSYAVVENPIRRRLRRRATTAAVALGFAAAFLATAGASLAAIDRQEQRFDQPAAADAPMPTSAFDFALVHGAVPAVIAAVEAAHEGAPLPSALTPPVAQRRTVPPSYRPPDGCVLRDSDTRTTGKVCRVGRPDSARLIVLMGDSHANMWLPPLLEFARSDGWAIVPLVRLGCTPGTWVTNARGCRDWYRWATGQAKRLHADVTLLGGSIDERPGPATDHAVSAILAAARDLSTAGRVVLIGDPEGLSGDPVDCVLAPHATMTSCTTTWPQSALAAYDAIQQRTKEAGIGFLPTRQFVCFRRQCPAIVGHTLAWMDNSHLTVAYSTRLAAPFASALLHVLQERRP